MKKIKALIETLAKLTEISDAAEEAYAEQPENEELERAFDNAYKAESKCRAELTKALSDFSGIDSKTAYVMTFKTFDQLKALAARV